MNPPTTWGEVEETLECAALTAQGTQASFYRSLAGRPQFWRGDQAVCLAAVEALDEKSECIQVSIRVAETHGFEVVNGWALSQTLRPFWHCFNHDPETGAIIDAANARRTAVGYYGKRLSAGEVERLRTGLILVTPGEVLTRIGERVGVAGRLLGSFLGD